MHLYYYTAITDTHLQNFVPFPRVKLHAHSAMTHSLSLPPNNDFIN